jgi:hypothetical protein
VCLSVCLSVCQSHAVFGNQRLCFLSGGRAPGGRNPHGQTEEVMGWSLMVECRGWDEGMEGRRYESGEILMERGTRREGRREGGSRAAGGTE